VAPGEAILGLAFIAAGVFLAARWRPEMLRSWGTSWDLRDGVAWVGVFTPWGIGIAAVVDAFVR
jgi:hypothetical protein